MENPETVASSLNNGVLTIALNRPRANAFNLEMILAAQKAFRDAARDTQTRVVVLIGNETAFSAGQDVGEIQKVQGSDISIRKHLLETYNPLILQIRRLEKPVIAAINGVAAGAGLGIALACDLRIAAENARFVVGFGGIGLAPDSGVSLFLPALIGLGRAAEFTFSNQPILAEQAHQWGLVNKLCPAPELQQQAAAWAAQLALGPAKTMGLAKRAFNKAVYPNLEEVLDYEGYIQDIASKTAEHVEGVRAFLEKRPANFK